MLLSFNELLSLAHNNVITPVDYDQINAASIDVRLGNTILAETYCEAGRTVSLRKREQMSVKSVDISDGHYDLRPGEFVLACTVETFNLPDHIAAEFKLKSSGARIGLNNVLATWCDNGWHGSVLTLELQNVTRSHTIRLHPGDRIGQMIFYRTSPVPRDRSYASRGRYNGDVSVSGVKP